MTDTERLARLEARSDEQERRLERIEEKIDGLLELAAIGKGAGWLLIKIGALLAGFLAAGAWLLEQLKI
jgi:hypothetical protein